MKHKYKYLLSAAKKAVIFKIAKQQTQLSTVVYACNPG